MVAASGRVTLWGIEVFVATAQERSISAAARRLGASPSAVWDQWTTNGDIGIGRFRFLTADWQTFNMHTASDSVLRANPPPVDQ